MKINTKLTLIFLFFSILPIIFISFFSIRASQKELRKSIGINIQSLAIEKANAVAFIIKERINEAQNISEIDLVKNSIRESNLSYMNKTHDEIQKSIKHIDKMWVDSKGKTKIADEIFNSNLSKYLTVYQNRDSEKYGEIFITDIKGATIAMTNMLSDYYQADEEWWKHAFDKGRRGKVFVDDRGYDQSVKAMVLGIAVPVKDNGKIIGILKVNYKVYSILEIVYSTEAKEPGMESFLASTQKGIIIRTTGRIDEELTETEKNLLLSGSAGWSIDTHKEKKFIMGFSPIPMQVFARVSNPGEIRGVSDEKWKISKWFMFLEFKEEKAFSPINRIMRRILYICLFIMMTIGSLSIFATKSITKPIKELIDRRKLAEEKYRLLVENMSEVFWMENLDGTELLYVSPTYEQIWGRTCQSFYDNPKEWINAIHPEDRQRAINAFSQGRLKGTYSEEFRIIRPDGSMRWIWDRSVLIKDEAGKVSRIAGIAADITERKKMEEQIKASLKEKEVLLREIHHRVKNNMQVVSSLLMLQSEYLNDEKDKELFKESQNRIKSMAIIHENLYQSEDLAKIDFRDYVKKLTDGLLISYSTNGNNIAIKIDIKDVSLGVETAIPCSLIINELISNSIKYAFLFDKACPELIEGLRAGSFDSAQDRPDERKGKIKIFMSKKKDGEIELIVADNGVSIPKDLDFRHTKTLGLQLVTGLVEDQLDGKIILNRSKGTEFRIRFKELQDKKRI